MMAVVALLILCVVIALLLFPLLLRGQVSELARRLERLEYEVRSLRAAASRPAEPTFDDLHAGAAASGHAVAPAPPPPAIPIPPGIPIAPTPGALEAPHPGAGAPEALRPRDGAPEARTIDMEQLIGGVWLQNLGAVLLLLGLFLMILWGYTTHRLGPGPLVIAGVAMGLTLVWRGDRVSRRVRAFGYALIGVGLGTIYLTLYLGYVRLGVLSAPVALGLLALTSFASISAGLRYRVQLIAALGVIGAFLPQFAAGWLHLEGFQLEPVALLVYLAVVDGLVFALAARAGWSALDLAALVLGALAWDGSHAAAQMGWGLQAALAALFTGLGLAPLPRLVRVEGRVRPIDLAVIAAAPLCLLVASAPFLRYADPREVSMLLFALALAQLLAALWVDARRPERDLWVPLTGAATLFFTAAIERLLGPSGTPVAWCAEGVVLVALGVRERGGWLRLCGSLVIFLGVDWMLIRMVSAHFDPVQWPVANPESLRELGCVLAALTLAWILARGRSRLPQAERFTPEIWATVGHLLLVVWIGREANAVATAIFDPRPLAQDMAQAGTSAYGRHEALAVALRSAAWLAQALALVWSATRKSRGFLRVVGYGVGAVGLLNLALWLGSDSWGLDQMPVVHLSSLLVLASIAMGFAASLRLARRRDQLADADRRAPELWSAVAGIALACWSARESGHVARTALAMGTLRPDVVSGEDFRRLQTLTAAVMSGAWLAQSIGLLVVGWLSASAFLRWSGLALLGVTLLKFIVVDLQTVDVFWRFLTAIVVGAAMLALSYAYQRRMAARPARR